MPTAPPRNATDQDTTILAGIEQRILAQINNRLADITAHYAAYIAAIVRENPDLLLGTELISRPDIHTTLTTILDGAKTRIEPLIRAGNKAAAKTAATGHTTPPNTATQQDDTDYLNAILISVTAAFILAHTDITDSIRTAFDSITGTATAVTATRLLAIRTATDRAVRRLGIRVRSAATIAIHRGYTDAQLNAHHTTARSIPIRKTWTTTSPNPCPACKALNGTTIPIDAEFDPTAGTTRKYRPPRPFRDLHGPPRHPSCRCRLTFAPSQAGAAIHTIATTPPPGHTPTTLTAEQVRAMPTAQYRALTAFFTRAIRRLKQLLTKAQHGG